MKELQIEYRSRLVDGYTQRSIEHEACESMTVVTYISVHQQTMVVPVLTALRGKGRGGER